jgi:hypothetical protein
MTVSKTLRCALLTVFAIAVSAAAAGAQASAYVPLDDVSYWFVDALMSRGEMKNLSGLERPYTRGELAAAIDTARGRVTSPVLVSWLDALSRSISKYDVAPDSDSTSSFHARFSGDLYATAQTSGRRELMLADGQNNVDPGATIKMVIAGGPIAGSIRGLIDNRLKRDPEFLGRKDRKIDGRIEDGYVSGQWKYGELTLGRVARNWGPPMLQGMQLGDYAYTYDQLYGKVGSRAIHISTVLARLDDDSLPSGARIARYLSVHRLSLRHASWEVGATESFLYTGVGRGFEPALSNPFNIYALSWRNERADGNLAMGLDGMWRTRRLGNLSWQIFLDDLQIDKCDTICHEPSSYGLTLRAEGLPLRGDHRGFASYTRVTNLAYRTPNPSEKYAIFNVGLGRPFSDYDEARIGADLALVRRTSMRLYAAYRRQGEGDYRKPFPAVSAYATTPSIFSGIVMKVARVGLSAGTSFRSFEGSADVGFNHATNADHVLGRSSSAFEGRVRMSWIPSLHLDF